MANRIFGRHNAGLKTTTKAELLALLARFDDDQLVAFSYNYGDCSRTEAVEGIVKAEEKCLTETAYSPSGFAVASRDEEIAEDCFIDPVTDGPLTVVVLS